MFSLSSLGDSLGVITHRVYGGSFSAVSGVEKHRFLYSFLDGRYSISVNLLSSDGRFRLIVLDVDEPWDLNKVASFQGFLFNAWRIRSYSGVSMGGRIHVYIPLIDWLVYKENLLLLRILGEIAKLFFKSENIEVFPNGRSITAFYSGVFYDFNGRAFSADGFYGRGQLLYDLLFSERFSNDLAVFRGFLAFFRVLRPLEDYEEVSSYLGKFEDVDFNADLKVIEELVSEVKGDYLPGERNNIIFELSGLMAFLGFPIKTTIDTLSPLFSGDEEKRQRIELIYRAYGRKKEGKKLHFSTILPRYKSFYKLILSSSFIYRKNLAKVFSDRAKEIFGEKFSKMIEDVQRKIVKFGTVFVLGYNSLAAKGYSKRDVSVFLKTCISKGLFTRRIRGRYVYSNGEKISIGSLYSLAFVSKEDNSEGTSYSYRMSREMVSLKKSVFSNLQTIIEFYLGKLEVKKKDFSNFARLIT